MYYEGRKDFEDLYRELVSTREDKAKLERENTELKCANRELDLKYQDLLLELKKLNISDVNKVVELEYQVKEKHYHLERCSLLLAEAEEKWRKEARAKEDFSERLQALREKFADEQNATRELVSTLKMQLHDKSSKLESYERLERELDKVIVRSANLPEDQAADMILASYENEAFIPLNSRRRLEQALHLARKVLELENYSAELKQDLFRERELKREVEEDLIATKAALLKLDRPTSELIQIIIKRNIETNKLRERIDSLEYQVTESRKQVQESEKELQQEISHKEQLEAIQKMITDLRCSQASVPGQPFSNLQSERKTNGDQTDPEGAGKSDTNVQYPLHPSDSIGHRGIIHIRKPLVLSKCIRPHERPR